MDKCKNVENPFSHNQFYAYEPQEGGGERRKMMSVRKKKVGV